MANKIIDIQVTWDWGGDTYALRGFNVCITPDGSDPNNTNDITAFGRANNIADSGTSYSHILRDVTLNDSINSYAAWVQALYEGDDSEWVSAGSLTVPDDDSATVASHQEVTNRGLDNGGDFTGTIDGTTATTVKNSTTKVIEKYSLIDPSVWVVGTTGSQAADGTFPDFNCQGDSSENEIVLYENPHGDIAPVWKCIPSGDDNGDGGWDTDEFPVDTNKTYRFSVFVKRTGSQNGKTYLGTDPEVLDLNDSSQNNAYFWSGDLPELDKWYLMVGFVHSESYTDTTSYGGVYDSVTGEKVINADDFKHKSGQTSLLHRAYLYYTTDTNVRQYFWGARVDIVDGTEPTIRSMLNNAIVTNKDILNKMELKPENSYLFHFNRHLSSTDGVIAEIL